MTKVVKLPLVFNLGVLFNVVQDHVHGEVGVLGDVFTDVGEEELVLVEAFVEEGCGVHFGNIKETVNVNHFLELHGIMFAG